MIKLNATASALALALLLLAFPKSSFASKGEGGGGIAGNGGDVIYCEHPLPGQKRIELLDLFESRILRENSLALGEEGWNYNRRIAYVLDRFKRLDPHRAGIYAENASHFLEESEFTTDELPDIPDSKHIALPEGCKIRQIVIQNPRPEAGQKRFLVNKPLWEMLDEENRAALTLHETIYREALSVNQRNSINTRFFNGTITSHAFDKLDIRSYLNLLQTTELENYRAIFNDKVSVDYVFRQESYCYEPYLTIQNCLSSKVTFFGNVMLVNLGYRSGNDRGLFTFISGYSFPWPVNGIQGGQMVHFQSARLGDSLEVIQGIIADDIERKGAHYDVFCVRGSTLSFPGLRDNDKCFAAQRPTRSMAEVQGRSVEVTSPGQSFFEFDPKTDRMTHGQFTKDEAFDIRSNTLIFHGEFLAYPSGSIWFAALTKSGKVQVPNSSQEITAKARSTIYLYEDGTVLSACLDSFSFLSDENDKKRFFPSGTCLKFDKKGRVIWSSSND